MKKPLKNGAIGSKLEKANSKNVLKERLNTLIFYHISTPEQFAKFSDKDFYETESLRTENFIHASFAEQLEETLETHYKNASRVLLLTIDSELLTAKLVVEKSRNGENFPHIYGAINKSAIVAVTERDLN
ncbi:MAG: DUF952 domain-containing protein [Pyrinomonadaceae bacterium]